MMKNTQRKLAKKTGYTEGFISYILNGKRRPAWPAAKILAEATGTKPELWLDGKPEQIKAALKNSEGG